MLLLLFEIQQKLLVGLLLCGYKTIIVPVVLNILGTFGGFAKCVGDKP